MVDHAKVASVMDWKQLKNVGEVRSFVGRAEYYRMFLKGFSKIFFSLSSLTRKDTKFKWNDQCNKSFQELKRRLMNAPLLTLPEGNEVISISSDASNMGLGGVIMQNAMIVYAFTQLKDYEKNYLTHDIEFAVVVFALKI
ncbi:uncharacterized mitochondrial protein AtMg00860-like [Humulus lupulus]|uniref:uncharacterized mitochondrial protein AtMg00860-like n=1 Tax=Humulus lupulus TaxID=3486 RepID=UPI002B407BBE|nr:uncharacterized mitochondrial protein AtMg00860-like [Humulus lupulus]